MPLTNSQHDAIMRSYDAQRTANEHIRSQRYDEMVRICPEIADIENEIISISMEAAASIIKNNSSNSQTHSLYKDKLEALNRKKAENRTGHHGKKFQKIPHDKGPEWAVHTQQSPLVSI